MMTMKHLTLVIIILVLFVVGIGVSLKQFDSSDLVYQQDFSASVSERSESARTVKQLRIKDAIIDLEIVDDAEERTKGLSGRKTLPADRGMLFVMQSVERHGIWMKDMHFSIDIIWLDAEKRVVGIEKEATPESYPDAFYPDEDALYVLEVNAGFVDEYGIAKGDTARFRLP